MKNTLTLRLSTALAALAGTTLSAQTTPPAPAAVTQEEAIVLSPFTVNTSLDEGYAATQTMSGTRLATNLRDVASVVSPMTIDFLKDIDATNLQQAILFTPGTDEDPRPYNSQNNNPVSTRIRGFVMTGNSQNFFPSHITIDRYNIDRIDINLGANSILYGIGSPGGGFSANTKNALFRNFGEVETRWDEFHSSRYTLDLNQQLVKKRVAIRVAALTQDEEQFRTPASNKEKRLYVAATLNVLKRDSYEISLRLQAERQYSRASVANWQTPNDFISAWAAAGSPTWNLPGLVVGNFSAGMQQNPDATNIVVTTGGTAELTPAFVYGRRPSSVVTSIPGTAITARLGVPSVTVPMIPGTTTAVPAELNYFGPARGYTLDTGSQSLFLEQTFFNKVFTELAYYRQDSNRNWIREGGGGDLRVDLLNFLPDGTPNPNRGRLYTQGIFRDQPQESKAEVLRLTASTEVDLNKRSKWLGRHRFGLLLEKSENLLGLNDRYEVNLLTQVNQSNLVTAANRIVRRSYLFAGHGDVWQSATEYRDVSPVSGKVGTASASQAGNDYLSGMVNSRIQTDITNVRSWVASLQSFFLQDRLLVFGGIRGDKLSALALDQNYITANTRAGVLPDWRTVPVVDTATSSLTDSTFTFGVIARPLPWLDVFFNKSEVLALGTSRPDVYNNPLPFPKGLGNDVGIRWTLLNGKLTGSFSLYEAAQTNSPDFQAQTIITQLATLTDGLGILAAQAGSGVPVRDYNALKVIGGTNAVDTLDNTSHGFDAELVYNPMPNWRWSVKFSRSINKNTNVQDRTLAYFNEKIYPLKAILPQTAVIPGSGQTVADSFVKFDQEFNTIKYSRDGTLSQRMSEYSAAAVTNYSFRGGRLKGFSVGGTARFSSEPYVIALLDATTGAFTGRYVMGPDRTLIGVNLGYSRKLGRRVICDLRLSISNCFNQDGFEPIGADAKTGVITGVRPLTPRNWSLSTAFRF